MTPLADRLRPRTLDEILGQEHLVGPGAPFRRALEGGRLRSCVLWGPPGTGKTTIATHLGAAFAVAGHRTALGDLDKLQVASACARPGTVPAVPTSH
jgi:replication-associated recombination protein RarA